MIENKTVQIATYPANFSHESCGCDGCKGLKGNCIQAIVSDATLVVTTDDVTKKRTYEIK